MSLSKNKDKTSVKIHGDDIELPLILGSENELGIDISKLRSSTNGVITIDQAFVNTASCLSNITYLDGEKGILRYRGYSIEELSEKATFLEVAYLLIFGELPNINQNEQFLSRISSFSSTNKLIYDIIKAHPSNSHPMGILSSSFIALSNIKQNFSSKIQKKKNYLIFFLLS